MMSNMLATDERSCSVGSIEGLATRMTQWQMPWYSGICCKQQPTWAGGEIGRRARLRIWSARVWVQVPPRPPSFAETKIHF